LVILYMLLFICCTLCLQTFCQNLKKQSCHAHDDWHDTISSSVHNANSVPKRIFNVCLAMFCLIMLYSQVDAILSYEEISPELIAYFVFACSGISSLLFVSCIPGGHSYRKYSEKYVKDTNDWKKFGCIDVSCCVELLIISDSKKLVSNGRIMSQMEIPILDDRNENEDENEVADEKLTEEGKGKLIITPKAYLTDKCHSGVAITGLFCLLISNGIVTFTNSYYHSGADRANYIFYVTSVIALISFYWRSKILVRRRDYTIVYLFETAAFFGIGMQSLFSSWDLNNTLNLDNYFLMVLEEVFLCILILPLLCGYSYLIIAFYRRKKKVERIVSPAHIGLETF